MRDNYWNHNTAYHPWILRRAAGARSALDVGCGDGLLLERLAPVCSRVTGIEPDPAAYKMALERTVTMKNGRVIRGDFLTAPLPPSSYDVLIFAASLHHMDAEEALLRATDLLTPGGALLVVGLARPESAADYLTEALRVIPARIGSLLHGEGRGPGVPVKAPETSLGEIRRTAARLLPDARIRRGLYYRYLLEWKKPG